MLTSSFAPGEPAWSMIFQPFLDHWRKNCFLIDVVLLGVFGFKPLPKCLRTFAPVACAAAKHNVCEVSGVQIVVVDVFPSGFIPRYAFGFGMAFHLDTAIGATLVAFPNLSFGPSGNAPNVHISSSLR